MFGFIIFHRVKKFKKKSLCQKKNRVKKFKLKNSPGKRGSDLKIFTGLQMVQIKNGSTCKKWFRLKKLTKKKWFRLKNSSKLLIILKSFQFLKLFTKSS
jgi:hypothetical protein